MTRIAKYPLERLRRKAVAITLDCPNCEGARLEISQPGELDPMKGIRCYKCKALVLLDSLSLTVVQDGAARAVRS